MFSSLKMRIVLGIYIFVIISIPIGAYLVSEQTTLKSKATDTNTKKVITSPKPSPAAKKLLGDTEGDTQSPASSPSTDSTPPTSFGPTLNLKVNFEGRKDNHSGRLFVGIVEGIVKLSPKFLLSFTIDLSDTGEYRGLSLAGLTLGTTYSALLKGSAQIASASAFIMSPTVSKLNAGRAIILLAGDLNEDNTVNSQDYSLIQKALGSNTKSSNWNDNADFNKDGIINSLDLAILNKNFGKIGDSGSWTSPIPKISTPSGGLTEPPSQKGGYWLWIPEF